MSNDLLLPVPGPDWCFFLDVDGTLIEIADAPEGVHVDAQVIGLLDALRRGAGGAVALVSGRPIAQLDRLFAPLRLPAAGLHGLEIRSAAGLVRRNAPAGELAPIMTRLRAFAAERPGVMVEEKGLTVAVHYRRAPGEKDAARALIERLVAELGSDYDILTGKMVFEIKPRGVDKGNVVRAFMAEAPFAGRRPAFIGDDVTDEAGFDAVNRAGGYSIRIDGAGPSHARYEIADVPRLRRWLAGAVAAYEQSG